MNKKGFTLIETLIVSTVVSGILVYLFIQFSTLKRNYNTSFKYNTVNDLYALEDVAEYIIDLDDNIKNSYFISSINTNKYLLIKNINDNYNYSYTGIVDSDFEDSFNSLLSELNINSLIVTKENIEELRNNIDANVLDKSMIAFINRIKNTQDNNYRLIAYFNDNTYANLIFKLGVENE